MLKSLEQVEKEIVPGVMSALARLDAQFEAIRHNDPSNEKAQLLGYTTSRGEYGPNGSIHRSAPIKFLRAPLGHMRKLYPFLPYFQHCHRIFEIGVGTGYLVRILSDHFGADVIGCEIDRIPYYTEVWDELGISDKIIIDKVLARKPLPLRENTEAVVGFWATFSNTWSVDDHRWFLDFLKANLVGEKIMAIRFNRSAICVNPGVIELYEKIGEFPFGHLCKKKDDVLQTTDNFCVIKL